MIVVSSDGEKVISPATESQTVTVGGEDGPRTFKVKVNENQESVLSAFSHKIPILAFLGITLLLLILSLTKKLSLIPILGLLLCLYLMTELGITNWIRFGLWLIAGLFIYALYGYRNSNLSRGSGPVQED